MQVFCFFAGFLLIFVYNINNLDVLTHMHDIAKKISLISVAAFLVFVVVLYKIDPEETGTLGFIIFYLSMFTVLFGIFFLIGFYGRKALKFQEDFEFRNALWQGGLLSFTVLGGVLLEYIDYLNIFTAITLFLMIVFLEPVFYKKNNA